MTTPQPPRPTDDEIDALIARRYCDTSPEFEARWVALKRDLRQAPVPRRDPVWRLAGWFGAAAAATVVGLFLVRPSAPPPEPSPQVRELLALDAALARAEPLLDEETRTALLHLSSTGSTRD
jgi:hypothetical protein